MDREIRIYPDEILRKRAEEVTEFNSELRELVDEMLAIVKEQRAYGLAANQIGVLKRVFVLDVDSDGNRDGQKLVFINPEIIHAEGESVREEGCLSLPGLWKKVKRAEKVRVKAQDVNGKEFILDAEGLLARGIQHEIDHLDGVVFIDRLSPLQRRLALEKYKKLKKRYMKKTASGR